MTTFIVDSGNDSGAGTLRQALIDANALPAETPVEILFQGVPGNTVELSGALPALQRDVTFTGSAIVSGGSLDLAGSELALRPDGNLLLDLAISGGRIVKASDAVAWLLGPVDADVLVQSGQLAVGDSNHLPQIEGTVQIEAGAVVKMEAWGSAACAVDIQGAGTLSKWGPGTLTLGGAIGGELRLEATWGTLVLEQSATFGDVALAMGAVVGAHAGLTARSVTGAGSVNAAEGQSLSLGEVGSFFGTATATGGTVEARLGYGSFQGQLEGADVVLTVDAEGLRIEGTLSATGTVRISGGHTPVLAGHVLAATLAVDTDLVVQDSAWLGEVGAIELDATLYTAGESDIDLTMPISGSGGIVQQGPGLLYLAGDHSYTGPTVLEGGTLSLNGTLAGEVVVKTGAQVFGDGAVGKLTVEAGGLLEAGDGLSLLQTGDLSVQDGATFLVRITGYPGAENGVTDVAGTVTLEGALLDLDVDPADDGALALGERMTIIDNDGQDDAVIGRFEGLDEGARFQQDGAVFTISYAGGDGNDVVLEVAEPVAPTLTGFGNTVTYNREAPGPLPLFSDVVAQVNDIGQRFDGLTLTVSGVAEGDVLVFGSAGLLLEDEASGYLFGDFVQYEVAIVDGVATVVLDGLEARDEDLAWLLSNISFFTYNEHPGASRTVTLTEVRDDGGSHNTAALSISATVNIPPDETPETPQPPAPPAPPQGRALQAAPEGGTLTGTAGDDNFTGLQGRDVFVSGGGSDRMEGGANIDTAVFAGPASEYTLTLEADGRFTVHGPNHTTTALNGIERLVFDDRHLALDTDGNTPAIAGLYQAAFGRAPDEGGLEFYGALLGDGSLDWLQMARNFLASPEYARLYGGLSDEAFVTQLYANALGREPDPAGFDYQVDRLAQLPDGDDRAALLLGFAQSPEMLAKFAGIDSAGLALLHG